MNRVFRRVIILLTSISLLAGLAMAAAPPVAAQNASQGIQVSPVIVDLNGEKGKSYDLKLTVTNVTAGTLDLKASVNDFTAGDESGNPKVILDDSSSNSTYSAKQWVSSIPDLTLNAKESKPVAFNVSIPGNAEAGGHYAVVRFSAAPPGSSGANVALTASVGTLLLIRVNGNVKEQLNIKEFFTAKGTKPTSLFASGPVNLVARIENTGNVHVKPVGTMTVKNMFGKTVASYQFGSNNKNVLPGTVRRYEQSFDKKFLFGRYTAQIQAGYGTTGAVLSGSTSFWVIPIKLIVFILIVLILIFVVGRKLLQRYNRHIVHRATHKHQS